MDEEEVVCEKVERKGKEIKKEKEEDYKFVILVVYSKLYLEKLFIFFWDEVFLVLFQLILKKKKKKIEGELKKVKMKCKLLLLGKEFKK